MSHKFLISVLVILTGFSVGLFAQPQLPPDTLWTRTYGTSIWEVGLKVQETTDAGFIIGGYSKLDIFAPPDVYAVKTDQNGNLIWDFSYGGPTDEVCYDIMPTSDGGYILVGYYTTPTPPSCDKVLIIKISSDGDTLWTQRYGGGISLTNDFSGIGILAIDDDNYIIVGDYFSSPPSMTKIFVMGVNADGDSLWCQMHDGSDATDLQKTLDGNYVIVGHELNYPEPYSEVILLKVDPAGNLIWSYTYGTDFPDYGQGVSLTSDGGYMITGYTHGIYGYDILLIKVDQSGNLVWLKNIGAEDCSEKGNDIISVSDGYVIAGASDTSGGYGYKDVYVLKTDLAGNMVWGKYIGGWTYDEGYSIVQTTNSGYTVCGYTCSFGAGSYDFYLVRFAPENAGVNRRPLTSPVQYSLSVYPNPFNASATLSFILPCVSEVKLIIYDITGQQVAKLIDDQQPVGPHSVQFDANNLPSGLYFAFLAAGEFKTTQKLLLVK